MEKLSNKKIYFMEIVIEHFDEDSKEWSVDAYWQDKKGENDYYALDEGEIPNRAAVIGYISEDGTSWHIDEPFMSIITENWLENRHVLESVTSKCEELKKLSDKPKDKKISLNDAVSVFRSMLREEILGGCEERIDEYIEEFRNNFDED